MNNRDASVPHSDEQSLEQTIQAKGLNAPRVTPSQIDSVIESEHYFTALQGAHMESLDYADKLGQVKQPDELNPALGLLTFCVLVLRNGFTVTGESACASPANFDPQIGRDIAKRNARDKIWALEGYLLRETLHRQAGKA